MTASDVSAWIMQHDWQMLLATTYVLLNVGPRPNPESLTGYKRIFWLLVDRIAWLSAEKVPGDWKWIFTPSPIPPAQVKSANSVPAPGAAVTPVAAAQAPAPPPEPPPKDPPPAA